MQVPESHVTHKLRNEYLHTRNQILTISKARTSLASKSNSRWYPASQLLYQLAPLWAFVIWIFVKWRLISSTCMYLRAYQPFLLLAQETMLSSRHSWINSSTPHTQLYPGLSRPTAVTGGFEKLTHTHTRNLTWMGWMGPKLHGTGN